MLRHEQQTARMALAAALHHSAGLKEKQVELEQYAALRGHNTGARAREEVVHDAHVALRGQKTPPPGVRPGSLVDPGPQRSDRTVRRSSGQVPLLVVALLADASADGVDAATLSFLTASALEARRKEEEERRKREEQEELNSLRAAGGSHSSAGEEDHRHPPAQVSSEEEEEEEEEADQWSACYAGFTGDDAPRVMFPSGVARPKMLRILAGIDQKDRCSGIFKAGFAGYNTPRAVLSFLVRQPMKLCIMAGMVQKDSCSGMARLVLLVTVHLVLCFLPCLQARDARHHGRYGPEGFVRHVQGLVCWVLTMSLALCSSWLSQAQDARHDGRHGPQDSVEVHRCSSWTRSFTCPLVCYEWRHGPDSPDRSHCCCSFMLELQYNDKVVDVPVVVHMPVVVQRQVP